MSNPSTPKPAHHQVNVIRITEVLTHPNADKLEIVPIEGYQAVVGKGQFKPNDLAYYVPPDSIVPDRPEFAFLWRNETFEGGTPIKKRRITAKKLRGEYSEGLLMPLPDGDQINKSYATILDREKNGYVEARVGDDISDLLGITHYDNIEDETASTSAKVKRPRGLKGYLWAAYRFVTGKRLKVETGPEGVPSYDVMALKKFMSAFIPNERVRVTEKIHGSNARFVFVKGGLFGKDKMHAGSRNLWKAADSKCAWRKALVDNPWIEQYCRAYPSHTIYGEITPTQKGYDYASGSKVRFFVFDVRSPKGEWLPKDHPIFTWSHVPGVPSQSMGLQYEMVPVLYEGPFDLQQIKQFVDGNTVVPGASHIREGIVITAVPERYERNVGRVQLKLVSNAYLEKDNK